MVKNTYIDIQRHSHISYPNVRNVIHRSGLLLHNGAISNVLTISGGPIYLTGMFMRITSAVTNTTCNMAWRYRGADGVAVAAIGSAVDIAGSTIGDLFWSELDGTAIVKVESNALMANFSGDAKTNKHIFLPDGSIDITLSATTLIAGVGELWVEYEPIDISTQTVVWPGVVASTTTTSSTTSSTSSSTSSTASTASTTSSTSSTASTASTASTTSSTSSTASTASTASTTSSTSSTASTASTTSTSSTTTSPG
jgi:hypothetical protein